MKNENKKNKLQGAMLDDNQLANVNGGMKIILMKDNRIYKTLIDLIMKIKGKKK